MSRGDCLWCGEPVAEEDGEAEPIPCLEAGPSGDHLRTAWRHRECAARATLGSLGHQRGRCACHGGTEEDPPGMTRREAARAALAYARGELPS